MSASRSCPRTVPAGETLPVYVPGELVNLPQPLFSPSYLPALVVFPLITEQPLGVFLSSCPRVL